MPIVSKESPGHNGELVLADSINELALNGNVQGKFIEGVYHDAGDKASYLRAIVDHALADEKLGPGFRNYLESRLKK